MRAPLRTSIPQTCNSLGNLLEFLATSIFGHSPFGPKFLKFVRAGSDVATVFENNNCFKKNFREECSAKGGTNDGSCASGFGVCCVCELIFKLNIEGRETYNSFNLT